jgi:hypothetical protein
MRKLFDLYFLLILHDLPLFLKLKDIRTDNQKILDEEVTDAFLENLTGAFIE